MAASFERYLYTLDLGHVSNAGGAITELCNVSMAPELSHEQKQHLSITIEKECTEWQTWAENNELHAAVSLLACWYYV